MIKPQSNYLRFIGVFALMFVSYCCQVLAFEGSTPENGQSYYLYNIYQAKFLSYGNLWGTQVSLSNQKPLLCTIESSDNNYVINTHYSLTDKAYKETYNNYLCVVNGLPYVNANYGDSDDSYTHRDATVFSFERVDEGYVVKLVSDASQSLMFDQGTACTIASYSGNINMNKSVWKLITPEEYNAYTSKKRFTVAALNVDGMPKSIKIAGVYDLSLNPDAKEAAGATAIGQKLKTMGYDVVGVSEDFNYHSQIWNEAWNNGVTDASNGIWSYNSTTYRGGIEVKANTYARFIASKSPLFDTDGLCLFYKTSNVNQSTLESSESWTAWNEHYGYTSDGADGMIDKGYRYYTVKLADGTEFDLYILHMDAETSEADNAARATQITQLADAIKISNNKRPIVIMGDTNCRYTRDELKSLFIDAIEKDPRFTITDPWIEFGRNNTYPTLGTDAIMVGDEGYLKGEVVDKVFYINNTESSIRIKALSYAQDLSFINSDGEPLADHWPAVVEFEYYDYVPSGIEGTYYFRNVETGYYLKAGGWWGTHAVVGDYGTAMSINLNNGKYSLSSSFGNVYSSGGGPYMDGANAIDWTAIQKGSYYVFNSNDGALAVTDTECKYGPNEKTVGFAKLDVNDTKQQWELLTAEQMHDLITTGTAANPFNCTHLMKFANFDRNDGSNKKSDGWKNTITTDASKMTYNLGDTNSGIDNDSKGNRVGEVYVSSYSSGSYETRWDISQQLTNLPNGIYKVTCQGFYRVNTDASKNDETGMVLYASSSSNTQSIPLKCMYSLQQTAITTGTKNGNYYYPNSMTEAAQFFNAGHYQNEVTIQVSDGNLKVAVAKTSTSKGSSIWTCFDNFQIYYLGEIANGSQYYIYNVDEGGFLNQGNNAGTQASLASEGLKWTVNITDGGYTLQRDGQSDYLGVAWNGLYVDWGTADKWDIAKISDGIYNITSTDRSSLIGWGGDPGCTVVSPALLPNDKEPRGTRWKLMSASDYSTYRSGIASAFSERQNAWTIIRSAISNDIDYSSLQTVYDKLDATAAEIKSAADATKQEIITKAANEASETNPVDVSFYITNATCGYSDFTGWTNTNFASNSTSMPNNSNDIALASRFYEKWVESSGSLSSSGSIKQTLSGLPNGCYYLVADAIAMKQDGNNSDVSGAILYAGDKSVTVNTPKGIVQEFRTDPFVVNSDTPEIGFKLENATANWVAIDNFRLYYLGGTEVTLALSYSARKGTFCSPYDVVMPEHVTAYKATSITDDKGTRTLNLQEVAQSGETLTAGTPVILCLAEEYTEQTNLTKKYYGLPVTDSDLHSDGYLCGVYRDDQKSVSIGNYLLQNQDNQVAFYKIVDEPLPVAKYRAYLLGTIDGDASLSGSKLVMKFNDEKETAIDMIHDSSVSQEETIYSMVGTKLDKLQHGVNIIKMSDGSVKKVLVK